MDLVLGHALKSWSMRLLLDLASPPFVSNFRRREVFPVSFNKYSLLNKDADEPVPSARQCLASSSSRIAALIELTL